VFFLSDRHNAGSEPQIYRISSREFGGDPEPLTPTENVRGVSAFEISLDGRWLAYISADEPADKGEEDKDTYVIVWRAFKNLGRLRVIDLSGRIKGWVSLALSQFSTQKANVYQCPHRRFSEPTCQSFYLVA
jgi:hypothetical protein